MRKTRQTPSRPSWQSINPSNWQAGVGMVEVLVSLFLVAISVLAFSGLQLQALRLTQGNTQLTAAAEIAADFKGRYTNMVAIYSGATVASSDMHKLSNAYMAKFAQTAGADTNTTAKVCTAPGVTCTLAEVVASDAAELQAKARGVGMRLGLVKCAKASESNTVSAPVCLLVAWGDTKPEKGSGAKQCITDNDVYNPIATCYRAEGVM